MEKNAEDLTVIQVQRLEAPDLHALGTAPGLRLNVSETGAKSWILRTMVGSKRKDIGLGGYSAVTLAMAIEKAREQKESRGKGMTRPIL